MMLRIRARKKNLSANLSIMGLTSDRSDPRLTHGADTEPTEQAEAYLVLSVEDRKKGFVRPMRKTYVHTFMKDGSPVPLVLTNKDLPNMGGCGAATTMATAIAETYAARPNYYAATYCVGCRMHLPVREFHWDGSNEVVGS